MNDYQLKRERDYVLPQAVYRQALYAVKDLPRLRRKLLYLKEGAYFLEGHDTAHILTHAGALTDVTGNKASEIATVSSRIGLIEEAFTHVPEIYRRGIEEKIAFDVPFSSEYNINTWKKWQQILIYYVAINLKLL